MYSKENPKHFRFPVSGFYPGPVSYTHLDVYKRQVYGRPCDTKKIQKIADKYGLKVIYDAAHAF